MKSNHKILFLLILYCQICITSVYSQIPTTEGKEFWLAFMANEKTPVVSINVSAKRACQLTIKNTNTAFSTTLNLQPGLNKILPASTPISEAYLTTSEVVENKSFLITSTDTISLFASNFISKRLDVATVLPTNALFDEYMIQTYTNSAEKQLFSPEFLIVATENNTVVDIIPSWKTAGGKLPNVKFSVTLNKGQSYQVQTENNVLSSDLSGSIVKAQNGKKIAVFNGNQLEAIPVLKNPADSIIAGGVSGGHLFEQAMPVALWGTEFVITRSLNRAVDKVRITAKNNDTKVKRNGILIATLQSGKTVEIEVKWPDKSCYIETSCPCAVYKYLVSAHKFDTDVFLGAPSMIWISPLEQMIKEVNFSTYNTVNTANHYINLIAVTGKTSSVSLTGKTTGNKPLTFIPVDGNPTYSYARTTIPDDSYTLKSTAGVNAHIYGLGGNESYGYTAGSTAKIQQGLTINNKFFISNMPDSMSICLGDTLSLFTEVKNIDHINWDMGNGTIITTTTPKFKYIYPTAGTYIINADIKSKPNVCDITELNTVVNAKVFIKNALEKHYYNSICLQGNPSNNLPAIHIVDTAYYQCDSIVYHHYSTNYETYSTYTKVAFNSFKWIDGNTYYVSTNLPTYKIKNKAGCDSIISLHLSVQECMEISIDKSLTHNICSNTTKLFIPYELKKGAFNRFTADFNENAKVSGFTQSSVTDNGSQFIVTFPDNLIPNRDTLTLTLFDDIVCTKSEVFTIPFIINYSNVIAQKWNDLLVLRSSTGFEFTEFQWFKNGNIIDGATGPYYYVGKDGSSLDFTADYTIELTRKDGVKLMSCPMKPVKKPVAKKLSVYPTVMSLGQSIHVENAEECTVTLIDPIGVKQANTTLKSGNNTLKSPSKSGVYILNVLFNTGEIQSLRLIVK